MASPRLCTAEGCDKPVHGRNWCQTHYDRWRKHGDANKVGRRGARPGPPYDYFINVVLPHQGDDCLIWPHHRNAKGYGMLRWEGKPQRVHRLVCRLVHGEPPDEGFQVHHTCHCGHLGCVNPWHLEWQTPEQNLRARHDRGYRRGA